jgi:uncharacterized protein
MDSEIEAAAGEPGRPGLALRVLRFPLTLMILELVVIVIAMAPASFLDRWVITEFGSHPFVPLESLAAVIFIALVWKGAIRVLEGQPDRTLELRGAGRELGAGLAFGALLFCAVVLIVALSGSLAIAGVNGLGDLWLWLGIAIISGFTEELLFRGILLRHLEAMLGTWAALAITAALFGGAHLMNDNATWFAGLAIALEAGVMLGAAYLLTRRLWLAIGIHAAWNFTQGWVFSIPVSGKASFGLLNTVREGPDMLTGGAFGLEASVVALILATVAGIWLLVLAHRAGRFVPPMWMRARTVPA